MKTFLIIWRIFLVIIFLVVLIWLINKNLFSSGYWVVERNFCQQSLVVSNLYPKDRMIRGDCGFRLIYEPVYFKVKLPVMFERVKVSLVYITKDDLVISVGLIRKRTKPTDWQFELKKLEPKPLGNNLFEAKTEFTINAGFINNHNLEFMISAPEVRESAFLEIKEIKIELFRQPLTYRDTFLRGFEYLKEALANY